MQKNLSGRKFCCTMANFQIEKKIGRGQFSEVYKARCLLEGQLVALKKVQVRSVFAFMLRLQFTQFIDVKHWFVSSSLPLIFPPLFIS